MFEWLFGSQTKIRLKKIEDQLRVTNRLNLTFIRSMKNMSAALDKIRAEVAENTATIASAELLISGLAQQVRDAIGNEAALNALADELDASSNRLAAAISENTPASPADPTDGGDTTPTDPAPEETPVGDPETPAADEPQA